MPASCEQLHPARVCFNQSFARLVSRVWCPGKYIIALDAEAANTCRALVDAGVQASHILAVSKYHRDAIEKLGLGVRALESVSEAIVLVPRGSLCGYMMDTCGTASGNRSAYGTTPAEDVHALLDQDKLAPSAVCFFSFTTRNQRHRNSKAEFYTKHFIGGCEARGFEVRRQALRVMDFRRPDRYLGDTDDQGKGRCTVMYPTLWCLRRTPLPHPSASAVVATRTRSRMKAQMKTSRATKAPAAAPAAASFKRKRSPREHATGSNGTSGDKKRRSPREHASSKRHKAEAGSGAEERVGDDDGRVALTTRRIPVELDEKEARWLGEKYRLPRKIGAVPYMADLVQERVVVKWGPEWFTGRVGAQNGAVCNIRWCQHEGVTKGSCAVTTRTELLYGKYCQHPAQSAPDGTWFVIREL